MWGMLFSYQQNTSVPMCMMFFSIKLINISMHNFWPTRTPGKRPQLGQNIVNDFCMATFDVHGSILLNWDAEEHRVSAKTVWSWLVKGWQSALDGVDCLFQIDIGKLCPGLHGSRVQSQKRAICFLVVVFSCCLILSTEASHWVHFATSWRITNYKVVPSAESLNRIATWTSRLNQFP